MREPRDAFLFRGTEYQYFHHKYNTTWDNERCVEVPIVRSRMIAGRVLEVGNVLSHYGPVEHTVIDKYEKGDGVINVDLFDFKPAEKFDLIISISTFEHIGYDEPPRPLGGPREAVAHALSLLSVGGWLIFTVPIGYNRFMDQFLRESSGVSYMRRTGQREWVECGPGALEASYGKPFPCANAIAIYQGQNS